MKHLITWILVADHQHARIFMNDGPSRGLLPVDGMTMDDNLPVSHEAGTHRPDIGFASRGGPSHGFQPRTNPHEQAALRFVDRISAALSEAAQHGAFDRLIVVAPPRALGELRERLAEPIGKMTVGELDLDLTKASVESVREHVGRFFAV